MGAFAYWNDIVGSKKSVVGFNSNQDAQGEKNDGSATQYQEFGLMAELMGRFGLILNFDDLSGEQLKGILEHNLLSRYERELGLDNIELQVSDAVLDLLIDEAMARETGARGITTTLEERISQALYYVYSSSGIKSIELYEEDGNILWNMRKRMKGKTASKDRLAPGTFEHESVTEKAV